MNPMITVENVSKSFVLHNQGAAEKAKTAKSGSEDKSGAGSAADIIAAAQYLEGRNMPPSMLIGHSLGGAAVIRAAQKIPNIKAISTIGAPFDPAHVLTNFQHAVPDIVRDGRATVTLSGRPFDISHNFIQDISQENLAEALAHLHAALLVLHAPTDAIVGIENAARIFDAARHPKSFITLDHADHLISDPADAEYIANAIAVWAARYIPMSPPAPPPGTPEGIVRINEADPNGFLQDITSGNAHHSVADEPLAYGGTNRGMSPYGFLSAGLGACTSMTIRMYARRKGWPLKHVKVDVTHGKVHAQDAGTALDDKIDTWQREITLEGPLSVKQRERLLEIADKCPVHRTLERKSNVVTVLAP